MEQAQALREVLVTSVARLKPHRDTVGSAAERGLLQYNILHEEYVRGRPNAEIIARLNIAPATLFRNRRDAVSALARDLEVQEEGLARRDGTGPAGQAGVSGSESNDPSGTAGN